MRRVVFLSFLSLTLLSITANLRAQITLNGDTVLKGGNPYYITLQSRLYDTAIVRFKIINSSKDTLHVSVRPTKLAQGVTIDPTSFLLMHFQDSQAVTISFTPTQVDTVVDTILIAVDSAGGPQVKAELIVTAMGVSPAPPQLFIPSRYDFGGVRAEDSVCKTLEIITKGRGEARITTILSGNRTGEFSVGDYSQTIQPDSSGNGRGFVNICYKPHYADASCYLVISWNDGDSVVSTFLTGYLIEGTASVASHSSSNASIIVSPNPSSGLITIDFRNMRSANVEITDMLGRVLSLQEATSHWTWNGSAAPRGSYFVRVSGVSSNGAPFIETRRVVLN